MEDNDKFSHLPGVQAEELKRVTQNTFDPFPSWRPDKDAQTRYDRKAIYEEYAKSEIVDWDTYCATKNYNPDVHAFPWKSWVREKKYKNAWESVRKEIEDDGLMLGPKVLLQQVRAVKRVPETLSQMLTLLQHIVRIHTDEMIVDRIAMRDGKILDPKQRKFSLSPSNASFLTSALKQTSEALYKSLGIDNSLGLNPRKWAELVETEVGAMDGSRELLANESKNPIDVEILGGGDMKEIIAHAFEKWVDKPGSEDAIEISSKSENLPTIEDLGDESAEDG